LGKSKPDIPYPLSPPKKVSSKGKVGIQMEELEKGIKGFDELIKKAKDAKELVLHNK